MPVDLKINLTKIRSSSPQPSVIFESPPVLLDAVQEAIEKSSQFLLSIQKEDGHWIGELEADSTLVSDTLKLWHSLGRVNEAKQARAVRTILEAQLPEGGWPIFVGGSSELNATVKAYVALRLSGISSETPVLAKARAVILKLGGLERVNSFEKTYLAIFGAYPWSQLPALPPEVALLSSGLPFNIYEVAYWSRTILVPLAVVYATRPRALVQLNLDELWANPKRKRSRITNFQNGALHWRSFFLAANHLLKWHEAWGWKPFRAGALKRCENWILKRVKETDGLGAIFPAMINAVFALEGLGYQKGDPLLEEAINELAKLEVVDGGRLKVQPCFSPVWDTALTITALDKGNAGRNMREAIARGAEWLIDREVQIHGDWAVKNPRHEASGWAFQYRNPIYPDVDDTAQVLLALRAQTPKGRKESEPFRRGLDWILSMQNQDGGWSSYDKDNNRFALNFFPFADHNAMLDPSSSDITGRILELLTLEGLGLSHPQVRKGVNFLKERQSPDGTWYGRWGVNYIYGTWLALRGLQAAGEPMSSLRYQRSGRWLMNHQNSDGGWGESCESYADSSLKGQGVSTPSQTAWALMSLISVGMVLEPAFRKGLDYLVQAQHSDGQWSDETFTGTGFPRVFYLKYHLYGTYFSLMALSEAKEVLKRGN